MLITFSSNPSLLGDLGTGDTLQVYPRVQDQESELFSNLMEREMEKISSGVETQGSFGGIQEGEGEAGIQTELETNQIFDKGWTQGVINQKSIQRLLSPRQIVMQKFMDSVEGEFGISPEVFVGALVKLSGQGLRASPREMTSQIIRELDLPEKEAIQLAIQYQQMLTQLEPLVQKAQLEPLAQKAQMEPSAQEVQFVEERPLEYRRPMMLPSMASDLSSDPPRPLLREIRPDDLNYESSEDHRSVIDDWGQSMTDSGVPEEKIFQPRNSATQDNRTEFILQNSSLMNKSEPSKVGSKIESSPWKLKTSDRAPVLERSENGVLTKGNFIEPQKNQVVSIFHHSFPVDSLTRDSYLRDSSSSSSPGEADLRESTSGKEVSGASILESNILRGEESARSFPLTTGMSGVIAGVGSSRNSEEGDLIEKNVERLLNQAQYIIKKGGGEASIKLIPEALGQVHLHVTVSEGRVSLQMVAETKEARSLIEGALKDLQSSLGVHHLSVDHVKVNVANDFSNDKSSGGGFERSFHQQSGFDFNQGREHARHSHGPVPVRPRSWLVGSPRYVGEGRGSGLNLVA